MKKMKTIARNLKIFTVMLLVFITLISSVSAQTVTMNRNFFYPGIYKETRLGNALLSNGVNSDVGADIAFALLGDTLNMAADSVTGGANGRMSQAATIAAGKNMDGIGNVIEFLRNKKVQLPRLSKFKRTDATFLEYDSGKWCQIKNGPSLSVIRADALDPMIRTDIPANAGAEFCRMPDGFYLASDGKTVFMLYSSKNSDESWYGIGFGDSYCNINSVPLWRSLASGAFNRLVSLDPNNNTQPTLIRMTDATANFTENRRSTSICKQSDTNDIGIEIKNSILYRNILFPDHFKTSGHGAALVVTAKGTNVMGDVLTSNTAQFISGAAGIPFYGTGAAIVSALSEPDVSMPRMLKRPQNDTVYLQYDNGSYCAMNDPSLLSVMRGGVLEVAKSNDIPSNVQPNTAATCPFPDGFFKAPDNLLGQNVDKQVYYLFSSSESNSSWYGMGFGDSYCKIPNEDVWRKLIGFAGGDGGAPQESLIRVPITYLFLGRTEKPCPTNVVNGVAR